MISDPERLHFELSLFIHKPSPLSFFLSLSCLSLLSYNTARFEIFFWTRQQGRNHGHSLLQEKNRRPAVITTSMFQSGIKDQFCMHSFLCEGLFHVLSSWLGMKELKGIVVVFWSEDVWGTYPQSGYYLYSRWRSAHKQTGVPALKWTGSTAKWLLDISVKAYAIFRICSNGDLNSKWNLSTLLLKRA